MSLTAIAVPSLRPEVDGTPFPGTELPDIPTALSEVHRWIDAGEVAIDDRSSRWHAWPDQPDFVPIYGSVSLNTGAAGIAWYSRAAAEVLDDPAHLERAHRALAYVADAWQDHIDDRFLDIDGTGLAYYGGLAGIGSALLGFVDLDPAYRETAAAVFDAILERRGVSETRPAGWLPTSAMLGDGGIVVALLAAADRLGDPRYLDAARTAGEAILAEERVGDDGATTWPGLAGELLHLPAGLELDGFELGNIGIAYVFARLATATGDERFRDAAARAAHAITASATIVGDAAILRRMGDTYSFGYCTGSSGVIRSFIAVYRATGDPEHLEWALRFGRGILRSGVPGRQTPGNLNVLHQCCGSAAVLETFIGLWNETADPLWLAAARAQADDILIRSIVDERGRRWYSESHVLPVGTLKAEVGHQVGAAGIALALLRLHAVESALAGKGGAQPARLPDDPYAVFRDALPTRVL